MGFGGTFITIFGGPTAKLDPALVEAVGFGGLIKDYGASKSFSLPFAAIYEDVYLSGTDGVLKKEDVAFMRLGAAGKENSFSFDGVRVWLSNWSITL